MLEGEGESMIQMRLLPAAQTITFWEEGPDRHVSFGATLASNPSSLGILGWGYCLGPVQTVRLQVSLRAGKRCQVGQDAGKGVMENGRIRCQEAQVQTPVLLLICGVTDATISVPCFLSSKGVSPGLHRGLN